MPRASSRASCPSRGLSSSPCSHKPATSKPQTPIRAVPSRSIPGAAAYFNGEQTSVLERFADVLYVGAIIVSLVGAVCAWIMTAWRGSGPRQEREHLQRLMTIFWEALAVGQDAIDIFDKEVDEMVSPGRWSALRMGRCRLRSSRGSLASS